MNTAVSAWTVEGRCVAQRSRLYSISPSPPLARWFSLKVPIGVLDYSEWRPLLLTLTLWEDQKEPLPFLCIISTHQG